jgi:large subunit ribosomal protein L13
MSTSFPSGQNITRECCLIDASGQILGRVASEAAKLLMGKHSPMYTPFIDMGSRVIVINAGKVVVTGDKLQTKFYYRYTGYPGGLRRDALSERLRKNPEEVLKDAVRGMLPKNRLGRKMVKKLRVFRSELTYSCDFRKVQLPAQKQHEEQKRLEAFRETLLGDMGQWFDKLSVEQKAKPLLHVGKELFTAADVYRNIQQKTKIGERFALLIHDLEHLEPKPAEVSMDTLWTKSSQFKVAGSK